MNKISPRSNLLSQSPLKTHYQKTVLSNGLRVVTEEIPYVRSLSLGMWIDVGSRDEGDKNNGISHFLEHMVFKGTKHYSLQEIARSLESVGGYLNAFTSKEHTCFYARALDTHLDTAVSVLADLVRFPLFDNKEIEKEKTVVLEELKNMEDDPDDLIHDYLDKQVYAKHPLAFPVIGKEESIRSITRAQLQAYTHKHYVPHKMIVAVTGNIKHENVVDLVQKYLGGHKSSQRSRRLVQNPKLHRAHKEIIEKPIKQAHVCMGTIGYSVKSSHRYPMLVMNTLLGEGMSSRLFQNLRERHGLAYTVYSYTNTMSDAGNFGVYIGTDAKNIDRSIDLIHKEFSRLKSTSVSRAELQRTKSQLKGTMMLSLESMSSRMMRLGSGELYYGNFLPLDEIVKKIDAVDAESIREVAEKILRVENFSTVIFKPKASQTVSH
jgi:predicted Zn-dependent peptidase